MTVRRAKIVCTLGPASWSPEMIDALIRAGMDVARLNFSHGTHEEHARTIQHLRTASARHQKPIAILADLAGPKIRTGKLKGGQPVTLRAGQEFTLTADGILGDARRVTSLYKQLSREVRPGDRILLADGLIELRVL
ncbi:MAG TPA: pyruvate kinase, partial [Candidatus Acidoferrales bacterium]